MILVIQPFIDLLQRSLEVILAVLNIATIVVVFAFLHPDLSAQSTQAVSIIFIILQILGKPPYIF